MGIPREQELATLTSPDAIAMAARSGYRLGTYADLTTATTTAMNATLIAPPVARSRR